MEEQIMNRNRKIANVTMAAGLAMVLGIGAKTGPRPEGTPVRTAEAKGARSFTEHGLMAELYSSRI